MRYRVARSLAIVMMVVVLALSAVSCASSSTEGQATVTTVPTQVSTPSVTAPSEAPTAAPQPAAVEAVTQGTVAPDVSLVDLSGTPVSLSDYRGRVVMLNFWASWCGHCRSEIPALNAVYSEFKDSGFEIVAVSLGENPADLQPFVEANEMAFTVLPDTEGVTIPLYQVTSVPASYFLDADGVVRQVYNGAIPEDVLRSIVQTLLDE